MIPLYKLSLHGLYGLYVCHNKFDVRETPLDLITLSLTEDQ